MIINALKDRSAAAVRVSEILASWCLPTLAEAVKAEEENADARRTVANFEALKRRFEHG